MELQKEIGRSPLTTFQRRALIICIILNALDGYDILVMPFAAPAVSEEWDISNVFLGYMLSGSLFGMAIGAILLTPLSDRFGRRKLTLLFLVLNTAGMVIGALAPSPEMLLASRVAAGIGIGGMIANLGVIVNEYTNDRRRGLWTGLYTAGYPLGAFLGGMVAGFIIETFGWREAFWLGAGLTGAMTFIAVIWLPESYQYLVARGDRRSLPKLNRILENLNQPLLADIPRLPHTQEFEGSAAKIVFGPRLRSQTFLMWVGYALLTSAFYFANSWTTKIIADESGEARLGMITNIMFNLGGVLGSILFGVIAAKFAPRALQAWTMLFGASSFLLFGFLIDHIYVAMLIGVLAGFAVTGGITGVYLLGPALYPAKARAAGFGWLMGIGRLTSISAPIGVGYILSAGVAPAAIFQWAAIPLIISAAAFFFLGRVRVAQGLDPEPTRSLAENSPELPGSRVPEGTQRATG